MLLDYDKLLTQAKEYVQQATTIVFGNPFPCPVELQDDLFSLNGKRCYGQTEHFTIRLSPSHIEDLAMTCANPEDAFRVKFMKVSFHETHHAWQNICNMFSQSGTIPDPYYPVYLERLQSCQNSEEANKFRELDAKSFGLLLCQALYGIRIFYPTDEASFRQQIQYAKELLPYYREAILRIRKA